MKKTSFDTAQNNTETDVTNTNVTDPEICSKKPLK